MKNYKNTDIKTISINIPKDMLREVAILQAEMEITRSQLFGNALKSYLKSVQRAKSSFNEEHEILQLNKAQDEIRLDIGRLSSICDELMNRVAAAEQSIATHINQEK